MRRVAPARQVVFLCQPSHRNWMWLSDGYFPAMHETETEANAVTAVSVAAFLDVQRVEVVPIPKDCVDGFGGAFRARPEHYLDPAVQAGISSFRLIPPDAVARGTARLATELANGKRDHKYGHHLNNTHNEVPPATTTKNTPVPPTHTSQHTNNIPTRTTKPRRPRSSRGPATRHQTTG